MNDALDYEWDEDKSGRCLALRGFDFSIVYEFNWDTAIVFPDDRKDYGEARFRALGYVDSKLFLLAFTLRDEKIRVISVRRAHKKEGKRYGLS